jgi:hypothetical protein
MLKLQIVKPLGSKYVKCSRTAVWYRESFAGIFNLDFQFSMSDGCCVAPLRAIITEALAIFGITASAE